MRRLWYTLSVLGIVTSMQFSCRRNRDNHPEVIIEKFNRESYYEKTKEARDELYHVIDSLLMSDDRSVICSALKSYSIENLSADVVIDVKNHMADSIHLNGLLTFDLERNPAKINDSTVLQSVSKALLVSASYAEEDGLYGARIQLEKLCH
ncbi:MAG: hypothetical protein HWD62_03785 [Cyclobacteriaceae bacterium]|nr:MAG: hypothetical protein HWD62_03785 [Cyclobacteriaceae bacterium]